jgi:uncharacterized protein with von Willebrand factor type A (vWA) domain
LYSIKKGNVLCCKLTTPFTRAINFVGLIQDDKNLQDVLQRAWGCLGSSKSLDEIDAEMNAMRQDWDRGWD